MIAQQLAGSKVLCEKACPKGNTALSLPACRAQTSASSLPSGRPPGHLGLTPLHGLSTAPAPGKAGARANSFKGTPTQQGWRRVGCCPTGTSFSAFT